MHGFNLPTTSIGPTIILGGVVVLLLGAIVAFLTIARAGRLDPDPTGARPMAAFLFSGAFATLWVAVIGIGGIVSGILGFFGEHQNPFGGFVIPGGPKHPVGDANVRTIVQGVLLVVISGLASLMHRRRGLTIAHEEQDLNSPTKKIARTYVGVVSFFSVAIIVVVGLIGSWLALQLIAPGIFSGASRTTTVKPLIEVAVVLGVVGQIFVSHQHIAPRPLRLFGGEDAHDHAGHDHDHDHGEAASLPESD